MKRIQYRPNKVFKRKESWKGRLIPLFEGIGRDKLNMQIDCKDRANSRGNTRGP